MQVRYSHWISFCVLACCKLYYVQWTEQNWILCWQGSVVFCWTLSLQIMEEWLIANSLTSLFCLYSICEVPILHLTRQTEVPGFVCILMYSTAGKMYQVLSNLSPFKVPLLLFYESWQFCMVTEKLLYLFPENLLEL